LNFIKKVYLKYDFIFALSDKDSSDNKNDIFNSFCDINNVYDNVICGFSNPCFEIWLYLHDNYRETEMTRESLVRHFNVKFGRKYKTDEAIYSIFMSKLEVALDNAERLKKFWIDNKKTYCNMNPCTNVSSVIIKLKKLDR
jgi:hypothetical protein